MSKPISLVSVLALASIVAVFSGGCSANSAGSSTGSTPSGTRSTGQPSAQAPSQQVTKLVIKDEAVGKGPAAKSGDQVTVNYTGWLTDGTKFDSSKDPGRTPFPFTVGAGQVIAGWDQGVAGMKVGGTRKLTIPSDLAYGPQGRDSIPPNATLVFEVELLKIN